MALLGIEDDGGVVVVLSEGPRPAECSFRAMMRGCRGSAQACANTSSELGRFAKAWAWCDGRRFGNKMVVVMLLLLLFLIATRSKV